KRHGVLVVVLQIRLLGGSRLLDNSRVARDRPRTLRVRQDLRDGRPLLIVVGVGDDLNQAAAVTGLLLAEGDLLARLPETKRRDNFGHLPKGPRRQRSVIQKLDAGVRPLRKGEPPDPLRVATALGVAVLDLDADSLVSALRDQDGAALSHARQV